MKKELKRCSKCKELKAISCFHKNATTKDVLQSWCKNCSKNYQSMNKRSSAKNERYNKKYYSKNKERIKENSNEYYSSNKELIKGNSKEYYSKNKEIINEKNRNYGKKYRSKNKEHINEKNKSYKRYCYYSIPKNRLSICISGGIRIAIKANKNGRHWETLVNYSLKDLMQYLGSKFQNGMSWDNYGKWHVDHIIPKALWEFESHNDREFKQCWALCNLQPLWAKDNIKKGKKILSNKGKELNVRASYISLKKTCYYLQFSKD